MHDLHDLQSKTPFRLVKYFTPGFFARYGARIIYLYMYQYISIFQHNFTNSREKQPRRSGIDDEGVR